MNGPSTKYQALFDQRAIFEKYRVELLERYGAQMEVFREKFLDVIQGLDLDGHWWGNVCQVADLLNELQNCSRPRSGPFSGFFESVFPSYLGALTDSENGTNYYLSTVELLALCICAKQNVIIVRRI